MNTSKLTVRIMLLSGGLAGLAGIMQVMGAETRITNNISPGFGFTAIIVALLGRLHPFGVFLAAVLIGVLNVGGDASTDETTRRSRVEQHVTRLATEGGSEVERHDRRGEFWVVMRDPEGNEFCIQ